MSSNLSPSLGVRADIQLVGPAIALLVVQGPVGFGNTVGFIRVSDGRLSGSCPPVAPGRARILCRRPRQ